MPPRVKITKEDIIKCSLEIIRTHGAQAFNARTVAAELKCSTQPIFSNFDAMADLSNEVLRRAYDLYSSYLQKEAQEGKYPRYKSFGMAYIRFAKEERELFKLLFMRDRTGEEFKPTADFSESTRLIASANRISQEAAELIHLEMWSSVHGIGVMLATSYLELDEELISRMLTDIYQGLCSAHKTEG
jgi:AcrR family transcriptional regulator